MATGDCSEAPNSDSEHVRHSFTFMLAFVEINEDLTWNFRNIKVVRQRHVKMATVHMRILVHRKVVPIKLG